LVRVISWIVLFLWKKGTIHEITRTKHETHYRLNLLLRQSHSYQKLNTVRFHPDYWYTVVYNG